MQARSAKKTDRFRKLIVSIVLLLTALIIQSVPSNYVHAATLLLNRKDKLSNNTASAAADHIITFTFSNFATPVGSIQIEFCSNDPIPSSPCVPPTGFDATGVVFANQAGETGFGLHANSNANNIILSRSATPPTSLNTQYEFQNIINPSVGGTFYVRLRTFTSTDATGISVQEGGIALSINDQFTVGTEVPPFLRFCAGVTIVNLDCSTANSFLIDLGEFSISQTKAAQSEMVAATNAPFGLSITINGTTLTSGNNTITALGAQTASSAGTSQFGINLRANSSPAIGADPTGPGAANPTAAYNIANQYRFQPGDVVATTNQTNDYRKFTVTYIANIDAAQQPGVYATTISFICLANF
jgi:hypothetical protein